MTTIARRVRQPGPAPEHGTPQCYRRGCHRPECTSAATASARKWKYLRSTGRSGFVPAEKVIARIWRLRAAGLTDSEIRSAARLSPPHIYQIIRTKKPVMHSTAARIFAVPVPENSGPSRNGALVSRLGTRRRLQVLVAEGWPAKAIDEQLGTGQGYTAYLLRGEGNDVVRLSTAEAVRALYAQLVDQRPEDHGIPAHRAKPTRTRAARKGWVGFAYWDADDFDNPDFTPAVEATPRFIELAENGLELERLGHSRQQAAERLGVTKDNLQAAIGRYRKATQQQAAA
ncbi:hypothetical protein ACFU76_07990 [Streptomyces sp. NPDC057539]|uniref:hypothetical protein n=1 Tax=Streptomyces sp. NPDC057539 TaxID=3346159 RepID=UPI00368FFA0F